MKRLAPALLICLIAGCGSKPVTINAPVINIYLFSEVIINSPLPKAERDAKFFVGVRGRDARLPEIYEASGERRVTWDGETVHHPLALRIRHAAAKAQGRVVNVRMRLNRSGQADLLEFTTTPN